MDSGITGTPVASLRKCGYCDCEKEGLPVFYCETCGNWVHSGCLLSGSPSPILFDNYFNFVCIRCSEDGKESFTRVKMTWNQVTSLALFNIAQSSPGKDGFHKWKEVVVEFIEKYWQLLFGSYKKKTSSWVSTIAATLSAGNPHQFTSGYGFFKESGWWKLTDPSIPPEYNPHSTFSKAKDARTSKAKISSTTATPSPNTTKMDTLRKRPSLLPFQTSKSKEKRSNSQKNCIENERSFVDMDSPTFEGCENSAQSPVLDASVLAEDCSSEASFPSLPSLQVLSEESDQELEADQQGRSGNAQSAFSPVRRRSIKLRTTQESITTPPRLHDMPLYEERSLLKRLDAYGTRLRKIPKAYQLRRKLLVRQRKRELNLPIFNFDKLVNKLLAEDLTLQSDSVVPAGSLVRSRYPQILDRFQSSFPAANVSAVVQCMVQQSLVGCTGGDIPESIVSPYTQRVLKPYIRRDHECKPLKLQVLQQIHSHGKSGKESTEPPTSSIDYCYVRHQHIASVNSLCHHFFWPGIDMTETLQYPDFTVVALYRKLVIGFGFMVPDVSFNEAYITFLFVHPDWRCAGIGTFMLYHLIQIFPLPLLYLANLVAGLGGTKSLSLPMFTVLRRFSILFTMILEIIVLKHSANQTIVVAITLMIGGSIIAASDDLAFDLVGYTLVLSNDVFTALNNVFMKKLLDAKDLGKYGITFYNCLIMFLPALLLLHLTGELQKGLAYPGWIDFHFVILFLLSCVMGVILMYSIAICTAYNSALTTTVVGCLKNILITYLGMLFGGDYKFSWVNFIGVNISVGGSIFYSLVAFRTKRAPKVQSSA